MRQRTDVQSCLLVADGGSTKTAWCLQKTPGAPSHHFRTRGMNPMLLDDNCLQRILQEEFVPAWSTLFPDGTTPEHIRVFYYGAGCLPSVCDRMRQVLQHFLPGAKVEVFSDLLGAARALCGSDEGIACILGTGANSCHYDGVNIVKRISPLGYILGDEGSGTALGKRLIADYLKGILNEKLCKAFTEEYALTEADVIRKVYREPDANRFLASFTPFLIKHRTHPDVHRILTECFSSFFERNVNRYDVPKSVPVHFVGGIAASFPEELKETAEKFGKTTGLIIQEPIENMMKYHMQTIQKSGFTLANP